MKKSMAFAAVLTVLFCSLSAWAEDIPLGNKILLTGVAPKGPGFNYYFESQYYFGTMKDNKGKTVAGDQKINTFAADSVLEYITPLKLLGATYMLDMVVPVVSVQLKDNTGSKTSFSGIGDLYLEPLILSWKSKYVDSKFIAGFNLPTGSAGITKNHWSMAVSGDFAIFFDQDRTVELALLPTYEFHSDNLGEQKREGDDIILKWAIGYNFLNVNEIGIHGYSVFQITDDSGNPTANLKKAGEDNIHGVGVQYLRWFESIGVQLSFLFSQEFEAKGRSQGSRFHLTLIKPI